MRAWKKSRTLCACCRAALSIKYTSIGSLILTAHCCFLEYALAIKGYIETRLFQFFCRCYLREFRRQASRHKTSTAMAPFNGQPSRAQQILLALAPKFTGFLSLLGSSYIIYDCLARTKRGRHTYHRLMVGLSVADMTMTTGLFLSTWPMPEDTANVAFAVGNTHTCAVVGFLEQAGVTAVLYNAALSVYYLLRIRQG